MSEFFYWNDMKFISTIASIDITRLGRYQYYYDITNNTGFTLTYSDIDDINNFHSKMREHFGDFKWYYKKDNFSTRAFISYDDISEEELAFLKLKYPYSEFELHELV